MLYCKNFGKNIMQKQEFESVDIEEFYDSEKSDDHAYSTDIVVLQKKNQH